MLSGPLTYRRDLHLIPVPCNKGYECTTQRAVAYGQNRSVVRKRCPLILARQWTSAASISPRRLTSGMDGLGMAISQSMAGRPEESDQRGAIDGFRPALWRAPVVGATEDD